MDPITIIASIVLVGGIALGIIIGLPVAVAMGLPSALAILLLLDWDDAAFTSAQKIFGASNSFTLLAIPLFILAGGLMNTGGIATRLIDLALVVAGRLPASLAQTTIVANAMFGAVSGASVASAAAVGTVLTPRMRKEGYSPGFAATVNAASSPSGMLIPPSNTFIIYALVSGGSIGALFMAGVGPGLLWALICVLMVAWYARKRPELRATGPRPTFGQVVIVFLKAIPALLMIFIVIGGIILGWFTATESAAIAVIYSFVLGLIQRTLPFKALPGILLEATKVTGIIMFLIGVSGILGYVLAFARIPQLVTTGLLGFTSNPVVILLIIMVVLLLAGTVMDPTPAILIFTPIFLPVVTAVGVDPIHFGAMMVFNMCLGNISPPIGNNLFVAARVGGVRIETVFKGIWPFFWALCIGLLIVTFVPVLSTWLPTVMGLMG
ncbi:TRAP transporter large permease [Microbacterium protaetiae]|uniref:TRAP transporter large permease n=1 Tax=Microbacterium protaetiae TaxID=2509458 RepID=A0A4P6ECF1_9MICO|nr:TRAP transporter large permease [Microbacterium protaetiae]QAY59905.1 TRAP transporter large permease [Microbacterium protaetiae]